MAFARTIFPLLFLLTLTNLSMGARMLDLWEPESDLLTYHQGAVLQGSIPISLYWYGTFSPFQKSIIVDYIQSLSSTTQDPTPSVSQWMDKINDFYLSKVGNNARAQLLLANQQDDAYSLGKSLTVEQISQLATNAQPQNGGIALVLTDDSVAVDDFCSTRCGLHGANPTSSSTFIWVGNSATQCPGHCAWPYNQPVGGPQDEALVAPNDIGCDGMVINIGIMLVGAITNPYGDGFYQGPKEAPLEAATACPGYYGQGAFSGYAGQLLVDPATKASYNANGANGRKFLVAGLMNPDSSMCSTMS